MENPVSGPQSYPACFYDGPITVSPEDITNQALAFCSPYAGETLPWEDIDEKKLYAKSLWNLLPTGPLDKKIHNDPYFIRLNLERATQRAYEHALEQTTITHPEENQPRPFKKGIPWDMNHALKYEIEKAWRFGRHLKSKHGAWLVAETFYLKSHPREGSRNFPDGQYSSLSPPEISRACGVPVRTVQRHTAVLRKLGFVRLVRRGRPGSFWDCNYYQIAITHDDRQGLQKALISGST